MNSEQSFIFAKEANKSLVRQSIINNLTRNQFNIDLNALMSIQ